MEKGKRMGKENRRLGEGGREIGANESKPRFTNNLPSRPPYPKKI